MCRQPGNGSHGVGAGEVICAHDPRNAQCDQDFALRRLSTGPALFDGVDRAGGDPRLVRQLGLGPTQRLSSGSNAVHDSNLQTWVDDPILALLAEEVEGSRSGPARQTIN